MTEAGATCLLFDPSMRCTCCGVHPVRVILILTGAHFRHLRPKFQHWQQYRFQFPKHFIFQSVYQETEELEIPYSPLIKVVMPESNTKPINFPSTQTCHEMIKHMTTLIKTVHIQNTEVAQDTLLNWEHQKQLVFLSNSSLKKKKRSRCCQISNIAV